MIPRFTDQGLLPPGVHETDLEELEERMGWSRKRRELLGGLEGALELMASCGVVRAYLDGSFARDKDRPNDVDGCYDVAEDVTVQDLERLAPTFPPSLSNREEAKRRFRNQFLPCRGYEAGIRSALPAVLPDRPRGPQTGRALGRSVSEEVKV